MNKEKEEYISLRQEIVTLCSAADTIIKILYVFLATYLSFSLAREDTIYILLSNIVIIPLYLLAIDRRIATCKIASYISVFHEEEGNKWEKRLMQFKAPKELFIFKYFSAKHFPFVFADCTVLIVFIYKTNWDCPISIYEIIKIILEMILFFSVIFIFMKYKKIMVSDYIEEWKNLKKEEDNTNKKEDIIKKMPDEIKQEFFREMVQKAKEEYQRTGKNPFEL